MQDSYRCSAAAAIGANLLSVKPCAAMVDGRIEVIKNNLSECNVLGVHLEGPYFSYKFRGAQDPKHLRNPSPEEYMEILGIKIPAITVPVKPGRNLSIIIENSDSFLK